MSHHPRSKRGEKTAKQKVAQDLEEKYLEGVTTPSQYEESEDSYSLFAVRTHYGEYPDAVNDLGFPAPKDIPGIYEELEELKNKWGKVDEEIYDAKGFFRAESIEPVLGMSWEEIDELL
ncbi:MAG: hypothetical protein BRC28_02595 [Nanohaloarchaea archaeon SW_4_43_9]|nr:MAG: hypothetical protein BRC28_02595 [Nanohaloarchaea archaeon SW_4_43_9]